MYIQGQDGLCLGLRGPSGARLRGQAVGKVRVRLWRNVLSWRVQNWGFLSWRVGLWAGQAKERN